MPGDPNECRERARECLGLARAARAPEQRQFLTNLAQRWLSLATDIEMANTLLEAYPPEQSTNAR